MVPQGAEEPDPEAERDDEAVVDRLRRRKSRPSKPLAVMVRDIEAARRLRIPVNVGVCVGEGTDPDLIRPLHCPSESGIGAGSHQDHHQAPATCARCG